MTRARARTYLPVARSTRRVCAYNNALLLLLQQLHLDVHVVSPQHIAAQQGVAQLLRAAADGALEIRLQQLQGHGWRQQRQRLQHIHAVPMLDQQ